MTKRTDLGIPYGIAKLRRYAADPFVPELAKGTQLHLILFQFKGTELVRLEEIEA